MTESVDNLFMTVDISGVTCDVDFDDPEDGTWLSASDSTKTQFFAYIEEAPIVTMLAFSQSKSEIEATLHVSADEDTGEELQAALAVGNGSALAVGNGSALSLI